MSGKIINLRTVRKQKKRVEKQADAEAKRAKFGRTGAQKKQDKVTNLKVEKHLDGHKLDGKPSDE